MFTSLLMQFSPFMFSECQIHHHIHFKNRLFERRMQGTNASLWRIAAAYILLFAKSHASPSPPFGDLIPEGEAIDGASFRDVRQIPIVNELDPNFFFNPIPDNIQILDPSLSFATNRGKSIDSSIVVDPQLLEFTPGEKFGSIFPSPNVGVLIPSDGSPAQRLTQQSGKVGRIGVSLPGDGHNLGNHNIGVQFPFSGSDNFDEQTGGTQFSLDRNTNRLVGVTIPSQGDPSIGIDLTSLLAGPNNFEEQLQSLQRLNGAGTLSEALGLGVVLPSSQTTGDQVGIGGSGVSLPAFVAQSNVEIASSQDQRNFNFRENENAGAFGLGVALPTSQTSGGHGGIGGAGVPLSTFGTQSNEGFGFSQDQRNFHFGENEAGAFGLGVALPSSQATGGHGGAGVSLPTFGAQLNEGIPSSQDQRNFNFQENENVGAPLPTLVHSPPQGNIVGNGGIPLPNFGVDDSGTISTGGSSFISSQGKNSQLFPARAPISDLPVGQSSDGAFSQSFGAVTPSDKISSSAGSAFSSSGVPIISAGEGSLDEPKATISSQGSLESALSGNAEQSNDISQPLANSDDILKEFEGLTIGELLMGINGQNGIMVLPMSSVLEGGGGDGALPELTDLLSDNSIGKSVQDASIGSSGSSASDVTALGSVGVGVSIPGVSVNVDLAAGPVETFSITTEATTTTTRRARTRPTTTRPPTVLRDILSDLLFSKGQWFGTLLGGIIDYGIIVRDAFRDNFSNRHNSYHTPKPVDSYSSKKK